MASKDYVYYKKGIIFSKAPHKEHQLTKIIRLNLLKEQKGWFLRNTYDFDSKEATSFWFIIKDTFGGMEALSRRTRNKVRHALKFFEIREISVELMREQGYDVYWDSFQRYFHTTDTVASRSFFLAELNQQKEGREFWGVIDKTNGTLVAYSENYCKEQMCEYFMLKARTSYLRGGYYPFYGLLYKMDEYYLALVKMRYVSAGSRSATEHSNIQPFLISILGFRKAYTKLSLTYTPWLKWIISVLYPMRQHIPNLQMQALLRLEAMSRGDI